jgi:hypothetical protein
VISNTLPAIVLNPPVLTNNLVLLNFSVTNISGITAATFKLLQEDSLSASWITNAAATFSTNIARVSYRFTTTNGPAARFYRVLKP